MVGTVWMMLFYYSEKHQKRQERTTPREKFGFAKRMK
jgi:hypothetical protein